MNVLLKSILQKIIAVLAKATLRRYKPVVIGITGSVGKTSTREAIFAVLKTKYRVRQSERNYNTEIGLPLTILGMPHYGRNVFRWTFAFLRTGARLLFRDKNFSEMLVLEYGLQKPNDIRYLTGIARPTVAVMTAIGEIPVHVEYFSGPLELAEEKSELFRALPSDGHAVYNIDDGALLEIKDRTLARKVSFGFDEHADIRLVNYEIKVLEKEGEKIPDGITFKITHGESMVPFRLHHAFGKPHAYAASAAAAVGLLFGFNLIEVSQALESYNPPPGRGRLLPGIKGSFIIDDTYNASPESMHAALDLLERLPGGRKIAVLGDMLEIGKYTEGAHRALGDRVAEVADMLIAVGDRARFIADEAETRGIEPNSRRLTASQVFRYDNPVDAGRRIDALIRSGDVIMVKGSQSMRMEKVVEEIMAEPERAKDLLARQDTRWRGRPFLQP